VKTSNFTGYTIFDKTAGYAVFIVATLFCF